VYAGDVGDTVAGRPSERYGVEFTNDSAPPRGSISTPTSRSPTPVYDTDQAATYQSLLAYPEVALGNAPGNYILNAPWLIASAGVTFGGESAGSGRWAGAISERRHSPRTPLVSH
jgi:hypothetical protein